MNSNEHKKTAKTIGLQLPGLGQAHNVAVLNIFVRAQPGRVVGKYNIDMNWNNSVQDLTLEINTD